VLQKQARLTKWNFPCPFRPGPGGPGTGIGVERPSTLTPKQAEPSLPNPLRSFSPSGAPETTSMGGLCSKSQLVKMHVEKAAFPVDGAPSIGYGAWTFKKMPAACRNNQFIDIGARAELSTNIKVGNVYDPWVFRPAKPEQRIQHHTPSASRPSTPTYGNIFLEPEASKQFVQLRCGA